MEGVRRWLSGGWLAGAILLGVVGCEQNAPGPRVSAADASRVIPGTGEGVDPEWPFWPRDMRVHPASRLVLDPSTGQAFIEARIEFRDAIGHTSKAVGVMKFDLIVAGLPSELTNPVLSWQLPMTSLEENELHYDDVTRTYLYRLNLGEWSSSPDVTLIGAFESIDGRRFDATQRFR
jgi:hypothetical protein